MYKFCRSILTPRQFFQKFDGSIPAVLHYDQDMVNEQM